jgi:hypothetical protein
VAETVGIGVLVEDTGETARTLQHWCDLGVLKPLPGTHKRGRGVAREFPAAFPTYEERSMALIASRLNRLRIPLAIIKRATQLFRGSPSQEEQPKPDEKPGLKGCLLRALTGRIEIISLTYDETTASSPLTLNLVVSSKAPLSEFDTPSKASSALLNVNALPLIKSETGHFLNLTFALQPLRSTQ